MWLRDGRKVAVKVPDDCLLVQAGIQLEHITGGYVKAGMHEVVCTDATVAAVEHTHRGTLQPHRHSDPDACAGFRTL